MLRESMFYAVLMAALNLPLVSFALTPPPGWPMEARSGVETAVEGVLSGLLLRELQWATDGDEKGDLEEQVRTLLNRYDEWNIENMSKKKFPTLIVVKPCRIPNIEVPDGDSSEELVAVLSIRPMPTSKFCSIYAIAVAESYLRLGIANTLLADPGWGPSWLVGSCPKSADTLSLEVAMDNQPAIGLYEKLGFHCDRARWSIGGYEKKYIPCTKEFKRDGIVAGQWGHGAKEIAYSLPVIVKELGSGDTKLFRTAGGMLSADYPQHFPLLTSSAKFEEQCAIGRVIVVLARATGAVIALLYADEESPLSSKNISHDTLVVYFAQRSGYTALGLQGWLTGTVLPPWIAHKQPAFKGKTRMGTFLHVKRDARAAHSLFGKLHYKISAVCDKELNPLLLGEQVPGTEITKLEKALGGLKDGVEGCTGTAKWGEVADNTAWNVVWEMFDEENEPKEVVLFVTKSV